ncbi:MAG: immunoglobulin-like domain-containing protein [Opitutales bacterium]
MEHAELSPDPLDMPIGESAIAMAASLSSDFNFNGPAFRGVSTIVLNSPLVGGAFTKVPTITFSGGNIDPATNQADPNFVSAKAEAFVNADGNITGIKILDSGAYYHGTPNLLVDGSAALSAQFTVSVENVCISWVVISTHSPGAAGLGYVGGPGSHVDAGSGGTISAGVIAHELGHNFGLLHANRYIAESEKPNSDEGTFVEYGSPYSVMGSATGDIANAGDLTIPSKVATKKISGFGLTIGKTKGVDVLEVSTSADLNNSPLLEVGHDSEFIIPNTFRIYRHDYGSAPLPLQIAEFKVSLPAQELGLLEIGNIYGIEIDGTGDHAGGTMSFKNGSWTLSLDKAGKGYVESPIVKVLNDNNQSIMSLNPDWIRLAAGTQETIQADLRDYSASAHRGLRGVEIRASQYSPVGTDNGANLLAYWLSFRHSANEYGLTVLNGTGSTQFDFVENHLLDMTPNTPGDFTDAFLLPGHTFSDYEADTHITPIRRGGVYPMQYLEVVLNMGTVRGGESKAPNFVVQTNTRTPRIGEMVEITAAVSDGNTSAYAYSWFTDENMESDITFLNKPTIYKSFENLGRSVVRVVVTDMKGGISSQNIVFNVGDYEKSILSSISGSVRSKDGFMQGARVVVEKAPIIEHTVSLQGSERDWYLPNGNNDPLKYNIDGSDSPKLIFRKGEVHRFRFDSSTEGFPMTFFEEPENEQARVKINMLVTPVVDDRAGGFIQSVDANVSGGSAFSTYVSSEIGTIDEYQEGRIGIINQPLIITRPYAKILLQDTNVTHVVVRPSMKDDEGQYISYGGVGHDRDNPPNVSIKRSSLWENYNETNATATAYVDGVGTIAPVSGITFLSGIWQNRANNDPIPELVVWGTGSGANATVEIYNRPNNNKPHRQIVVHDQGINFEPNGTMAVLHYPLDPLMSLSFDRHETLYDEPEYARYQPSPVWNSLVTNRLTHYWNFDEVNGTMVNDQVTNGSVNLNLQNGIDLSDANRSQWGTKGRSVRFEEDNAPINSSGTMLPNPPYTLSVWLNPDENDTFLFNGGFGATDLTSSHAHPGKREFSYDTVTLSRSTIHNPWVHIAIVAESGGNGHLYVDGNRTAITGLTSGNFYPDQYSGLMDEMHIYSKAMTETEVKRLAGRLFLDLSGNRLHAVPIGTDFNMSAPPVAGATGNNQGVSTERPGVANSPRAGNSKLGDTFPGENHGNSIYFDDNDSHIDLANNITSFSGLNQGSISFWIRTPGTDESGDYADLTVLSASDIDDNESYFRLMVRDIGVMQLHVVNDGTEVAKFYTNQSSKVRYEGSPGQNDWHHVVLVVDANKSAFWVDGKKATSIKYSSGSGDNRAFFSDVENMDTFTIGLHQTAEANATNSYRGSLDDFNFYDRTLTSTEINYLYNLRKGKEQLPRLEAVVDAVGTVEVTQNGLGYKETPDVFFSYGQEGNLSSELISYSTETDLSNETNASILVHGKLAFVQDTSLIYSYHYVRDESDSSWRQGAAIKNNGWREYGMAFGKGELNATGVDRILWTKDTERLTTIQLPDDRNVSHRYLEYVVEENGSYAAPFGLSGYTSPPDLSIGTSSTDKNASAYALFFIDQNNSAEIVNPGRGYTGVGFNANSVRISGPGFRPEQINRVITNDFLGNPNIDVVAVREEEYITTNRPDLPSITEGNELSFGGQNQHVFNDWTTGNADHVIRNDMNNTDFNQTLSHVKVSETGSGFSLPVSVSLVGGYPTSEILTQWVMSGNTTEYVFTPAQIEVNATDENGTILSFNIVNSGAGYAIAPTVLITGGGGFGARAIANIDLIGTGSITEVILDPLITNPGGRGYFNKNSGNIPSASLVHSPALDPNNEQDANLTLRLGGSLESIPTCGGCRSGSHIATRLGTHTEVWIEIWDKNRTEAEIDANGDRALAVAKVKNGKIEKAIVVESGYGYIEPVVYVRGAGSKHMNYRVNNNNYNLREWRCVNLRESKAGTLVECGHIQRGMYPPEQCTGEVDSTFPASAEESDNAIANWNTRHLRNNVHLCDSIFTSPDFTQLRDYNASAHLSCGFKSRVCSGTKVNFVLLNDVYRWPYESWTGFDANLSALVDNGRISEILVHNQGAMYASSEVHIFGTGGGVDAIPVFNDAGLNTRVIFDDPKLKNLETDIINNPIGAGQGFQERPWSWDMRNEVSGDIYNSFYTPTFGVREKVLTSSVFSSINDPETSFGSPTLNDNLGDRVLEVVINDNGLFKSDRNVSEIRIDFNGSHRPDANGDELPDFLEASAHAYTTNRLTKIYFDNNGTYLDGKGTVSTLDDRWKSLFTAQPVVNIIDQLGTVSVSSNNKSPYLRLNGMVDYDSVVELGYFDLYVDDRLPSQFFYGSNLGTNSSPSMGGEIIITEGLPGMNWALNEPNEKNTTAYTDRNGFYSLSNLEPGLYNVAVFMEDENFQESTFRSDGNGSTVTEVLYVPGIPNLTMETDGRGSGNSRLIWTADSRLLSRPSTAMSVTDEYNYEQKTLEGIGAGFRQGEMPQLTVVPSPSNISSASPKLITTVMIDGSLKIEIVDDENTTAFYPNDQFTLHYSSSITGVDFREDFLYSRSRNSSWSGTLDAPNRGTARLEIFPNDGNGNNPIEVPISSVGSGDHNFTFRARAYDGNGTMLTTEGVTWSIELDFNSSEGNNSNVAALNSPQYYIYGDDGANGLGYYYPVYLTNNGLGPHHTHTIDGKTVYMESDNANHGQVTFPSEAALEPFPSDFNKTSEMNLLLRSTLQRGRVESVAILSPGTNYNSKSQLLFLGEGNDFNGSLVVDGTGKILDVNISNGGSSYNSNSQIQIIDANASGASLLPVLGGGSFYLVASMNHGGAILSSRIKVSASPRAQLSSKEIWLNRYLDSTLERNNTWWNSDLDGDGLSNFKEWSLSTNPYQSDSDGDGLSDLSEEGNFTNPMQPDTDSDGLNDFVELTIHSTNPLQFDSDLDGWSDGYEVSINQNPLVKDIESTGFLSGIFQNTTILENNVSSYLEFNNSTGSFYKKVNLGATSRYPHYFYQDLLPQNQTYTLTAFIDRNGNGEYSAGEPTGLWEGNVSSNAGLIKIQVLDPLPSIQFAAGVDENVSINPSPENLFPSGVEAYDPYEGALSQANITVEGNGTTIFDRNQTSGVSSVKPNVSPGYYELNFYASDGLGTKSEIITQKIVVRDVTNPALLLFQDNNPTLEAGTIYSDPGFYAYDNVDGDITNKVSYPENFISTIPGINYISYTVTDSTGNSNSTQRSITVVDTTKPTLLLNGDTSITMEAGDIFNDPNATWVDNADGTGMVSSSVPVDVQAVGRQLLSYVYTDKSSNISNSVTRSLTIVDTTPSSIFLNGNATTIHEAGQPFVDPGASWIDNADGNGTVLGLGDLNSSKLGEYDLVYSYKDESNNSSVSLTRKVQIIDTTAPQLQLVGDQNITTEVGFSYTDQGAIWMDAIDGNGTISSIGTVNVQSPGVYLLNYFYTDQAGNAGQPLPLSRTVTVKDTLSPNIVFPQKEFTPFIIGQEIVFTDIVAVDLFDGDITSSLQISYPAEFDANKTGSYLVNFSVTDSSGNLTSINKRIHILDAVSHSLISTESTSDEGWFSSNWLGSFYPIGGSWIYHLKLGWLNIRSGGTDGYWIWDSYQQIWWWTNTDTFPFIYLSEVKGWQYLDLQNNPVRVYNYQTSAWSIR